MISSFEGRNSPGYFFSFIPKPAAPFIVGMIVCAVMVMVGEDLFQRLLLAFLFCVASYLAWDRTQGYSEYQLKDSREEGESMAAISSFGEKKEHSRTGSPSSYSDYFGWKTDCVVVDRFGESVECLIHHDGAVSLAFLWDGVQDLMFGESEFSAEHKRKLSLLKAIANLDSVFVEHHLIRFPDTGLVDAYELEGRLMFGDQEPPQIVKDVRAGIAELGRNYGRSNRVLTVLSLNDRQPKWFGWWPSVGRRQKGQQNSANLLVDCWHELKSYYPRANVLGVEQYQAAIQLARNPTASQHAVDWRFALNDQLLHTKPEWNEQFRCFKLENGVYCKVALLFKYPDMPINWTHLFTTSGAYLHVAQGILPKSTQAALDKNKKKVELETDTASQRRSTALLSKRMQDIADYEKYVADRGLVVADNVFSITFFAHDPNALTQAYNGFADKVHSDNGLVRSDRDMQWDMYRTRLPGLVRSSLFLREDHGDNLAAMMPFTTLPSGSAQPESLRFSAAGNLVGSSPSKLKVPHELVVADTGAGKDSQFGIKVLETYPRIRYDIVELTNTYQGLIEAIGGRYCQARDVVINPMMSYDDFAGAYQALSKLDAHDRMSRTLLPQLTALTPIFKGVKGEGAFTPSEEVVMHRALSWIYSNPQAEEPAPTLPRFEDAFHQIQLEEGRWVQARDTLGEQLVDFLNGTEGSAFKSSSQFIISPVANAIDFDRMEGKLADFFLTFLCVRLANNAFARGARSQIVLNEYAVLLERNPDVIRWITLAIDRLGRKDAVGLTRISQGLKEVQSVDAEALNSIQMKTLLYRKTTHRDIGDALHMPDGLVRSWEDFNHPKSLKGYREAVVCEEDQWYQLILKFPEIGLKLMNTDPDNKSIRMNAYAQSQDTYERIAIMDRLMKERKDNERQAREKYADAIL